MRSERGAFPTDRKQPVDRGSGRLAPPPHPPGRFPSSARGGTTKLQGASAATGSCCQGCVEVVSQRRTSSFHYSLMFLPSSRKMEDGQTFLVGQPAEAMFVWPNLATADRLYGQASAINQPQLREAGRQQQGGHVISTETTFESSLIKDRGCWHETKRRRKDGAVRVQPQRTPPS